MASMPPPATDVRQQLDRILASESFAHAERASRFLRYVVERALAGEADGLKEYAIGVDVFERGADYDPRLDSIVRVEAGRLRSKVEEYYSRAGQSDAILIRLRRGSYAPLFEYRTSQARQSPMAATSDASSGSRSWRLALALGGGLLALTALVAWRGGVWPAVSTSTGVRIAVLPFSQFSTEQGGQLLADRITDSVTTELARHGTLSVVSRTSAQQFAGVRKPLREIAQALNVDLVMEGSVAVDNERVVVNARLVRAAVDRKFWVEDFTGTTSDLPDLARRIAAKAAAAARESQLR